MSIYRGLLARYSIARHVAFVMATGCSPTAKAPSMVTDESSGPLANVILLPLVTRSTDNLLGHAWNAETDLADPFRAVITGTVVVTNTDQHVTFLREVSTTAEVNASVGVANAGAAVSHVTLLSHPRPNPLQPRIEPNAND